MFSWQHQNWINRGSPWKLATPIDQMVKYARRHGIQILGTLGNEEHLDAQPPEDHTPYSETAWPVPLPGDYVTACDLGNTHGLGPAILRDARAGRCPWLKYMNFGGRSYSHEDGFQSGWMNADEHIHLSCRSDWCTRSIGDYDPLGAAPPTPVTEEDPMFLVQKPGDPRVYLANMITRRWVRNEEDLANIRLQATNGTISVWHNGEIVPTDDPEAWGVFVGAGAPPAPPPAGGIDYDLLAAKVADLLAERLKS